MRTRIDLVGQKFGMLTVREMLSGDDCRCDCDCGESTVKRRGNVKSGNTLSCGCATRRWIGEAFVTHGDAGVATRACEYRIWTLMRHRCNNPKDESWADYGGRRIKVCPRWDRYENFLADMGRRPDPSMSIDRIDNNKGYEESNCRWATREQQARNKRTSTHVIAFGQDKTIAEWSEITGIPQTTIWNRIDRSWPAEMAVSR